MNQDKNSVNRLSEELGHKWESIDRLSNEFEEYLTKNIKYPVLSGKIEINEIVPILSDKGLKKQSTTNMSQRKRRDTWKKDKSPIVIKKKEQKTPF